jgi:hypothetical protein
MTEDVNVAIVRTNFETLVFHTVPLVQDFRHLVFGRVGVVPKSKTQRAFIGPVAGITLHPKFHVDRKIQNPGNRESLIVRDVADD